MYTGSPELSYQSRIHRLDHKPALGMTRIMKAYTGTPILLIFIMVMNIQLLGQERDDQAQNANKLWKISAESYGKDPLLVNGIKYNPGYGSVDGHPFLFDKIHEGSLIIKGQKYEDHDIRFNLLKNDVILINKNSEGAEEMVILTKMWVDQFRFGIMIFEKDILHQDSSRFVQVIYRGKISCYMDWKKEINLRSGTSVHAYYFSDPLNHGILEIDGQQSEFKSRWSFLKNFENAQRKLIRSYFKRKALRFKKAETADMKDLMVFINKNII